MLFSRAFKIVHTLWSLRVSAYVILKLSKDQVWQEQILKLPWYNSWLSGFRQLTASCFKATVNINFLSNHFLTVESSYRMPFSSECSLKSAELLRTSLGGPLHHRRLSPARSPGHRLLRVARFLSYRCPGMRDAPSGCSLGRLHPL